MNRRHSPASVRLLVHNRRDRFRWMALLVLAGLLVRGANLAQAQQPAVSATQPPSGIHQPIPTSPHVAPRQSLVAPPQAANRDVITPPEVLDRGMTKPTPSARVFPTPVIRPQAVPPPP